MKALVYISACQRVKAGTYKRDFFKPSRQRYKYVVCCNNCLYGIFLLTLELRIAQRETDILHATINVKISKSSILSHCFDTPLIIGLWISLKTHNHYKYIKTSELWGDWHELRNDMPPDSFPTVPMSERGGVWLHETKKLPVLLTYTALCRNLATRTSCPPRNHVGRSVGIVS